MKEKFLLLLFYALLLLLSMKKEIAVICFLFVALHRICWYCLSRDQKGRIDFRFPSFLS